VSVAATPGPLTEGFGEPAGDRRAEPPALSVLEWSLTALALLVLVIGIAVSRAEAVQELDEVVLWLPLVMIADLLPVTLLSPVEMTMSLPVLLGAAMLFSPFVAFLLGFAGTTDRRELRREIPLARGLFNRANVAFSVLAASLVFRGLGGNVESWPRAVVVGLAALSADMLVNHALMLLAARLLISRPISALAVGVYGGARSARFFLAYVCFGLVALLMAAVYRFVGSWSLVAFLVPIVLAHELFSNSVAMGLANLMLMHKERALQGASDRIADERREERLSVAADLHDELLPPLFKVHLMGQVIRQDLSSGRLLDLDEDVPSLLSAVETANDVIRVLIRDLRRSPLGTRGLRHTLALLAQQVASEFGVRLEVVLDEVKGSPVTQLLAYQVAREALNNCVKHAATSSVRLELAQRSTHFSLIVQDSGRGFDLQSVDTERHFGLALIRERVELAGGTVTIESHPGQGTRVAASFPTERV
jgi:signal transduction histidine kinase